MCVVAAVASSPVIVGASFTGVMVMVPFSSAVNAVLDEPASLLLLPSFSVTVNARLGSLLLTVGSSFVLLL